MKRYVPGLVPESHRVLKEYFVGVKQLPAAKSAWNPVLSGLAIVLFILAIPVSSVHLGFSVSLLVMAILLLPRSKRWLESNLRFHFTGRFQLLSYGALLAISSISGTKYLQRIAAINQAKHLAEVRVIREKQAAQAKEKARKDSLASLLADAESFKTRKFYKKAIPAYLRVLSYGRSSDPEMIHARDGLANSYSQTGNYQLAVEQYTGLLSLTADNGYYLQRGRCYRKLGSKRDAIGDFYQAAHGGNSEAAKLYEQMNPKLRRVSYYQTVCCDGSYSPSNAKGRGACSHHGGVCNWNYPIYEYYRKYDFPDL